MARATDMNPTSRWPRDRAVALRGALLSWAVLAAVELAGGVRAQTPDPTARSSPGGVAPVSQNFANGNPQQRKKRCRTRSR